MASERTPQQIIGDDAYTQLVFEGYVVTRPDATGKRRELETVAQIDTGRKWRVHFLTRPVRGEELVTRSQAEELLAAITKERDHWKEYSSGQGKLIESGVFVTNDEYVRLTALEDKLTEREELVLYNEACDYNYVDGYPYAYMVPHPNGQYVSRSQAEELLAAERERAERSEKDWQIAAKLGSDVNRNLANRVNALEADNAALTARVKELETEVEKANDLRAHEWQMRRMAQCDADLWRFSVDMGDHPSLLVKVWKQRKALETKLAAAEQALEEVRAKGVRIEKEANACQDVAASLEAKIRIKVCDEIRAALGGKPS